MKELDFCAKEVSFFFVLFVKRIGEFRHVVSEKKFLPQRVLSTWIFFFVFQKTLEMLGGIAEKGYLCYYIYIRHAYAHLETNQSYHAPL